MVQWDGSERRDGFCPEHPNCVYRIELLEEAKKTMDSKLTSIQKLLIGNLAAIITLLLGSLTTALIWIAKA